MTIDVKAGSFTASAVQSTNTTATSGGGLSSGIVAIQADSAQALVKISSSNKLSGSQKNGLIQDIAVVDRFASENTNLRKTLLNDVARSTVALEKTRPAVQAQPVQKPEQVAAQYVEARKRAESIDNGSARIQQDIQRRAEEVASQSSSRSVAQVSVAEVKSELQAIPSESVRQVQQAVESVARSQPPAQSASSVKDTVEIRGAKSAEPESIGYANEVRLPGSGTFEAEAVALPGSGSAEFEEIALPGSGDVDVEAVPLPGSGDSVDEIELPGSGATVVEAVPLPGAGTPVSDVFIAENATQLVSQTSELIETNVAEAEAAVVELELPGRVLSGAEAEEQQAALRRVLQSL